MEVYELWVQIGCNFEMYKNKRALQVVDLQGLCNALQDGLEL